MSAGIKLIIVAAITININLKPTKGVSFTSLKNSLSVYKNGVYEAEIPKKK